MLLKNMFWAGGGSGYFGDPCCRAWPWLGSRSEMIQDQGQVSSRWQEAEVQHPAPLRTRMVHCSLTHILAELFVLGNVKQIVTDLLCLSEQTFKVSVRCEAHQISSLSLQTGLLILLESSSIFHRYFLGTLLVVLNLEQELI